MAVPILVEVLQEILLAGDYTLGVRIQAQEQL
jgi:hypothetical protein